MKDVSGEELFLFLNEFEENEEKEWANIPGSKKDDCYKYLTLIKRFKKNPSLLKTENKKWILLNSDLPAWLIPNEILDKKDLWL